ncbi:MAG: cellobiose phosphorylase [Clostridiales bacterium]|nr:cellobiose phosphorylase [Clostridiales bacterium]
MGYEYTGKDGEFKIKNPDRSYLYFPDGAVSGMMGSLTPEFGGDLKTSQNTFVLEPVSSDNLHNNRSTRNFWLAIKDGPLVSATGASALQHALKGTEKQDDVTLYGGFLYQRVERELKGTGLTSEVTTFVPVETEDQIELTKVKITNNSSDSITFTPTAAVPIYGRSADNIRDHRNVTSMLNRLTVTKYGVVNCPTLTFDERGHRLNEVEYGFFAATGDGKAPSGFCPVMEDFIGEGGALDNPAFPVTREPIYNEGYRVDGFEGMGAALFDEAELKPGESAEYVIALTVGTGFEGKYLTAEAFDEELKKNKEHWSRKVNISFRTGDKNFDNWMYWVGIQPILRRIYGCSFLPHHDYGKGGRGWRDLWQDCLALIIMDPADVRGMLIDNFGGVRTDGTNATIIGSGSGEFIADRNGITRVWMDHAMWPFMTMELYIKQSGDIGILNETAPYFIDRQVRRGELLLEGEPSAKCEGAVLEHLLLQNMAAYFDIGENGTMKLRGADWNDALDMAKDKGESVAFTAAYAGNYRRLAQILRRYAQINGDTVSLAKELTELIGATGGRDTLMKYCDDVRNGFDGTKEDFSLEALASDLELKADVLSLQIRQHEWFTDSEGYSRFNSYYDNNGRPLEANGAKDGSPAMMLTGQVFTVMSGVADEAQVKDIIKSADKYLYDEALGGYRLNTNFNEIKTDMGRMFGFAYGQKENGAVFSHMTVMYGNALYSRGFKEEGWKVIGSLYRHASDFENSKIYPGIPEYFDPKGRGVYHYLTGAASWLILTVLTEMFGVKGQFGDMKFEPKLLPSQFDENGQAGVDFEFNGRPVSITYVMDGGCESVAKIEVDGELICEGEDVLPKEKIGKVIKVTLK